MTAEGKQTEKRLGREAESSHVCFFHFAEKLYANPLRDFARNRDTEIVPLFDAKLMFGNIEAILPANEAFLHDLKESLHPVNGYRAPEHWANVTLRHVSEISFRVSSLCHLLTSMFGLLQLRHFSSLYPAYILNLESAKASERELRRRNAAFRNFIEVSLRAG